MVSNRRSGGIRAGALAVTLAALGGCAYLPPPPELPRDVFTVPQINRGNLVTADQIAQITPGVSTRRDVQAAWGSPSQQGTFTDDVWYYISATSRIRPARPLSVTDQRVVVVQFDGAGVVREVREVGEAEMPRIAFASRETPSPGTERTLLQALFGNIGRFSPLGAGEGGSLPGPNPTRLR